MKLLHWTCFLIVVCLASSTVQAQSIADAARQERERRKHIAADKAPLTNESVRTTASSEAPSPAPVIQEAPKAAESTGPKDNQDHDEKYWRDKFAIARQDLKRAEDGLRLVELKLADLNTQLLREGIYTDEVTLRAQIDQATKDRDVAQRILADAQQKVTDLEEELRRADGPPGWARPN